MKIDTSGWKEFKLVDLFTYERGTRLTKNNRAKGKYPLVTAGEYNKGIKEYINNENQKIFNNAITVDSIFSDTIIFINQNIQVYIKASSSFGSISLPTGDSVSFGEVNFIIGDSDKILYLNVNSAFGQIRILYK